MELADRAEATAFDGEPWSSESTPAHPRLVATGLKVAMDELAIRRRPNEQIR